MNSFSQRRPLAMMALLCLAPCTVSVHAAPTSKERAVLQDKITQDPALIRYYAFSEGQGDTVRNLVDSGVGTLNINANDPYLNDKLLDMLPRGDYPLWTQGRWAGKSALSIGKSSGSVSHSFFYNVPSNAFSVEAWIRLDSDANDAGNATFFSIGNGFDNGWKITTNAYQTSFVLGRPQGAAGGAISVGVPGRLSSYAWHHIVAVYNGDVKEVAVYIDGKAGKSNFEGTYTQLTPPASNESTPELDRGGLMIGATPSSPSQWVFDVDELAIYGKALSADTVAQHFQAGQPTLSAAEQVSAHQKLLAEQDRLANIGISLPPSPGYFPVGQAIPVKVTIPPQAKLSGAYQVEVQLQPQFSPNAKPLWQKITPLNAYPNRAAGLTVNAPATACGLYRLTAQLKEASGKVIKNMVFPMGVRLPQLPITQMPPTSPMAHFGATSMHSEDLGLGGNFERIIHPWSPPLPQGGYEWKYPDLYVQTALDNGLVVMYTIMPPTGKSFEDMANDPQAWGKWVRELVTHFKGHIPYWEVLNEPNAGGYLTAPQYVTLLKEAFTAIREVDPKAKVVGIGGTANFDVWTEDVLAGGGGAYLDIICFHNYIGTSPIQSWSKYHKVDSIRAAALKYIGHPVPLWNGECGIHQPVRVQGRPMTDAELLKAYPGRSSDKEGWPTASVDAIMMTTEHRAACWQVQSILLDLASGAEKYFMLMGSGRYYPYTISTGQGFPSEKGLALAAMSSVTTTMQKIRFIPLSVSGAIGMLITDKSGKNTAVFFADKKMTLPLDIPGAPAIGVVKGIDFQGNPLSWQKQGNRLSLSVSDEPIYLFNVPDNLSETRLISVTQFPEQVSPRQTVQGEITVVNSSAHPLSGQLQVTSADSRIQVAPSVSLAAGERKKVPFTLVAGDLERGAHTISTQLLQKGVLTSRSETTFVSEGVAIPVAMSSKPIVLDGDASDWAGIVAENGDKAEQVVIGRPDVGVADARWWQGPKDLSYSVKTMWRPNDGVYLFIEVKDNVLTVAPEGKAQLGYLWDCLELFFDGRSLENQTTTYSVGAEQTAVIPQLTATATSSPIASFARSTPTLDVEFVSKRTADGYLMEGRIKPRAGSPFKVVKGTHFGMDVTFDDADNGQRRVQMALHGSQRNSFDTSQWGRYILSDGK